MLLPLSWITVMAKLVLNANKHPKQRLKGAVFTAPFLLLKNALDGPLCHFSHRIVAETDNWHDLLVF